MSNDEQRDYAEEAYNQRLLDTGGDLDRDDHAAAAAMSISFAGEAWESFQAWVHCGIASLGVGSRGRYFVQITEADTGNVFDAWLIASKTNDDEWGDTVTIVRNDDDGDTDPDLSKVENVRVDRIHIY